jgi:hypothetical protein
MTEISDRPHAMHAYSPKTGGVRSTAFRTPDKRRNSTLRGRSADAGQMLCSCFRALHSVKLLNGDSVQKHRQSGRWPAAARGQLSKTEFSGDRRLAGLPENCADMRHTFPPCHFGPSFPALGPFLCSLPTSLPKRAGPSAEYTLGPLGAMSRGPLRHKRTIQSLSLAPKTPILVSRST